MYVRVLGACMCMFWEHVCACSGSMYVRVLGACMYVFWEHVRTCSGSMYVRVLGACTYVFLQCGTINFDVRITISSHT